MKNSLVVLSCLALLFGCSSMNETEEETEEIIDYSIAAAQNEFAWKLFEQVNEDEEKGNVFISPYSIFMALAMTGNGTDGETKEEMMRVLEVEQFSMQQLNEDNKNMMKLFEKDEEDVTFQVANAVWLHDKFSFQTSFIENVEKYYNGGVEAVDMTNEATVTQVNDWVENATNGKIDEIVEAPLDPLLVAMLTNAVYFDGTWQYEFNKEATLSETFYGENEAEVEMMMIEEELSYFESDDFEFVQLPYGEGEMHMYVLLPKEGEILQDVQESLTLDEFTMIKEKMEKTDGTVKLPKFTVEYETMLNDTLIALGMERAFDSDRANFSNMITTDDSLWIDFFHHKTFIDVDEKGTEAAAVSNVGIETTSAVIDDDTFFFEANRPFQYFIVDESSEAILFMGEIDDLSES